MTVSNSKSINDLFGDAGWLHAKDIFPSEIVSKLANFVESRHEMLANQFFQWSGSHAWTNVDFPIAQANLTKYAQKDLPDDLNHFLHGEFDLQTRLDLSLVGLFSENETMIRMQDILNSRSFYIHYPPMLRFKMADAAGSILPMHQDAPYNAHLKEFITVWVPLVNIDDQVGGLILVEGTQQMGPLSHDAGSYWNHGLRADFSKCNHIQPRLVLGDALIFPSHFVHGSAPHIDKKIVRYSIDFRIFRHANESTKSYYDPIRRTVVRQH